jgi:hypothetical protein
VVRTAEVLLTHRGDPNATNNSGESLLYRAILCHFNRIAQLLRTHGAVLDLKSATLLALPNEVSAILHQSGDPTTLVRSTPLLGHDVIRSVSTADAVNGRAVETLRILSAHGLDLNQRDVCDCPLLIAAITGRPAHDLVRALIACGCDVNAFKPTVPRNCTALDVAIDRGDYTVAALLRTAGGKRFAELQSDGR